MNWCSPTLSKLAVIPTRNLTGFFPTWRQLYVIPGTKSYGRNDGSPVQESPLVLWVCPPFIGAQGQHEVKSA